MNKTLREWLDWNILILWIQICMKVNFSIYLVKNIFENVSPCICNYLLRVLEVQIEISCHKNNNMQQEILINAMD